MFPEIKPLPMHEGIYGLAANVILLIGLSLVTKPNDPERVEKFAGNAG
jgi:SSS family solute:Na+ symporter